MAKHKEIDHTGHRERMRKKFIECGFDGFSPHEIIEMLLFYCVPRRNTNELAHEIINKYKTLANVFDAPVDELMNELGISEVGATLLSMISKLSKVYEKSKWGKDVCLPDTESLGEYAIHLLKEKTEEEFDLICLDANRCVHWCGKIVQGTIDETPAYPREVAGAAIRHKAVNVVFVHNHPHGTLVPSVADKKSTDELVKILNSIGIDVLDHIIVSGNGYFSMREMGFIK